MTRAIHHGRSVAHSFSSKLLVVLLNAATGILTARALHPEGRGELAAVLLWPMVLSGSLTLGLPSALTYHMRSSPDKQGALVKVALLLGCAVGLIGTLVAIVYAPQLLVRYPAGVVQTARWLMPNLIVGLLLLIGRAALEAERNFARSGLVLALPPLLTVAGLSVLLALHRLTPASAGVAYIVAGLPAFVLLMRSFPPKTLSAPGDTVEAGKRLLSYGMRSYGVDLCGTVSFYIDQAVVVGMLSPSAMGIYAVSLSLSRVVGVPHQALAAVLFPSLIGVDRTRTTAVLDRALRLAGTATLIAAGFAYWGGHALLALFYGQSFAQDALILPLLTLEAGLSGCVLLLAQAFMASNRPGVITIQQIVGLSASLPLLLWLVPRYGIRGAALSILLSTFLRLAFICTSFRRAFGRVPSFLLNADSLAWLRHRVLPDPGLAETLVPAGGAK